MGKKRRWFQVTIIVLILLLVVYAGSYLVLSRMAFARADVSDWEGFYFAAPEEDTDRCRSRHYTLVRVYYPLIVIDNWIGTGRPPGSDPDWRLN
jgi:hypothetical protein